MKIYKLVICYDEEREELEYIEESVEDDSGYDEPVCIGTVDMTDIFEEFPEYVKYFRGPIGKA